MWIGSLIGRRTPLKVGLQYRSPYPVIPITRKPKGRPDDVIGNAVKVMMIAVGEEADDAPPVDGKNKAAQELGRMGSKGRTEGMSVRRRKEIARNAAKQRWQK